LDREHRSGYLSAFERFANIEIDIYSDLCI